MGEEPRKNIDEANNGVPETVKSGIRSWGGSAKCRGCTVFQNVYIESPGPLPTACVFPAPAGVGSAQCLGVSSQPFTQREAYLQCEGPRLSPKTPWGQALEKWDSSLNSGFSLRLLSCVVLATGCSVGPL